MLLAHPKVAQPKLGAFRPRICHRFRYPIQLYIHIYMRKHNDDTIKTSGHSSLENIPLTFFERVTKGLLCERWVGDWRKTATPSSSGYSRASFSFCWAAQPGAWGAQPLLGPGSLFELQQLTPNSDLQLTDFQSHPGYIIVWHPPASCGVIIRTQFNPSTVKGIPWYLRPDAPVIYTGAFLSWQLGRVWGQYVTIIYMYISI